MLSAASELLSDHSDWPAWAGDLPTWLATIATVPAAIWAAYTYWSERREQYVRMVYVTSEYGVWENAQSSAAPHSLPVMVTVHNAGALPISNVLVTIKSREGSMTSPAFICLGQSAHAVQARHLMSARLHLVDGEYISWVSFRDAAGNCWQKADTGERHAAYALPRGIFGGDVVTHFRRTRGKDLRRLGQRLRGLLLFSR